MVMPIYGNAPTTAHVVTLPLVAQKSKLTHGNQDSQSKSNVFLSLTDTTARSAPR